MNEYIGPIRDQFNNEAAAVKNIIYDMINTGNIDDALQLLEQYILINPADPEINDIQSILDFEAVSGKNDITPDVYGILKDIETIFVLNKITFGRIGVQDSVLKKVKLMEDVWNYIPLILTCYHNIDQRQAQIWLHTAGNGKVNVSTKTRIINIYDYFQNSYVNDLENKATYFNKEDSLKYIETEENIFDVYSGDILIRQEYYTGYLNSLRMVRNYLNGKKTSDFIYDDWGYLNCIREYTPENENIYNVKYYTTNGTVCIEALYKDKDEEKDEPDKLILFDEKG